MGQLTPAGCTSRPNGLCQPKYGLHAFSQPLQIGHAQQMFSGKDYDWTVMFGLVRKGQDTYVEAYATSFNPNLPHHAALLNEIANEVRAG